MPHERPADTPISPINFFQISANPLIEPLKLVRASALALRSTI